jgi:hypothetical protein
MNECCDCVIGLREANAGSGVGLFNRLLAGRLGVPHALLDDYAFRSDGHPLLSLKFEELSVWQQRRIAHELTVPGGRPYSLFLHTLQQSDPETLAIRGAARVLCGNDYIHRTLLAREGGRRPIRAFAPSLIPDEYRAAYQPGGHSCFTFGMAGKVDRARFARLRELTVAAGCEIQLLCSLAVHQTSDGSCLPQALDFLTQRFGDRFVYLGTLTDQGIAYLLNACPIFVGFYPGGVRSNNTTFNTALRFGKKIITNLDAYSPDEARQAPQILNLDQAGKQQLQEFLQAPAPAISSLPPLFTWDELVALCRTPLEEGTEFGTTPARAA